MFLAQVLTRNRAGGEGSATRARRSPSAAQRCSQLCGDCRRLLLAERLRAVKRRPADEPVSFALMQKNVFIKGISFFD